MFGQIDFTVKALVISDSLHHRSLQMKAEMNVKIGLYTKLSTQNKILASMMRNLKQQKASVFAPLILRRWIKATYSTLLQNLSLFSGRVEKLPQHVYSE